MLRSVSEWLQEQPQQEISREYFQQALLEIRRQMYEEQFLSTVLEELRLYSEFSAGIDGNRLQAFPRDFLVAMLKDRGIERPAAALQREEKRLWNLQEVQNFVERFHLVGDLQSSESRNQVELVEEAAGDLIFEADDAAMLRRPAPTGAVDFAQNWKPDSDSSPIDDIESAKRMERNTTMERFAAKNDEKESEEAANQEEKESAIHEDRSTQVHSTEELSDKENEPPEIPSARKTRKLKPVDPDNPVIEREQIEAQPPGPYPSLYTFMDEKTRRTFIKKLFGNDEEAFAHFVDRVDQADSWKEAKAIFDEELARRRINVYSKNAIKLSDFLFSRYFSRNRY